MRRPVIRQTQWKNTTWDDAVKQCVIRISETQNTLDACARFEYWMLDVDEVRNWMCGMVTNLHRIDIFMFVYNCKVSFGWWMVDGGWWARTVMCAK